MCLELKPKYMAEFHFRTWVSWCQYKSVRSELAFLHTTGVLWLKCEEEIPVTQNQITTNALCGAVYNYTECGMSSILKFSFWIPVWHSFGNCFFANCITESYIKSQEVFGTHPAVHQTTHIIPHSSVPLFSIHYWVSHNVFFMQLLLGIEQWRLTATWTQVC